MRLPGYSLLAAAVLGGALAAAGAEGSAALAADRMKLADGLLSRGMAAQAAVEYEALLKEEGAKKDEVLYWLGECRRQLNDPARARAAYDRVLADYPESRFLNRARFSRALLLAPEARERELLKLDAAGGLPADLKAAALYQLGLVSEKKPGGAKEAVSRYERLVSSYPGEVYAEYARIRVAALYSAEPERSRHDKALGIYMELSESKDRAVAAEAMFFAGRQCFQDARYEEALTLFRRLRKRFPDSARAADARVYYAWALYSAKRYSDVLETLRADAPEKRGEGERYLLAASLRMLSRYDDAEAAYTAALAADPEGRYAADEWLELLQTRAARGDHAAVLRQLAERPDPPGKSPERAWWIGGQSAQAVTNTPLAIQYMRLCSGRKDGVNAKEATYSLGWLLSQTGAAKEAAAVYRSVVERWPKDPVAAQALYAAGDAEAKAGDMAAAKRDWTNLLSSYPGAAHASDALYRRATEEVREKDYRAARLTLDEFVKRFPEDRRRAEATYFAAYAAERAGDDAEAEKLYRAALAGDPAPDFRRECLLALGALLKRAGRAAEAADSFARLISDGAVARLASDRLAWAADVMLAAGKPDEALKAAEALRKRDADANWNQVAEAEIGAARLARGENDAALAAFRRALAFDARTTYGAQAALEAGRLESAAGRFDAAKKLLSDAVERARSDELLALRAQAYAALAANEDSRGAPAAALEYYMIVGALFDDPALVPPALWRAAQILREQGKEKDAADLAAELRKRYPDSAEAKSL